MTRIDTDWADQFRTHPEANDVEMAAILGCTPQTVKLHRCTLGLPRRYGRPSPVATSKPVQVWTRCTEEDKAAMEGYADACGQTVSDWIRDACREHIGRMVRIGVPERMESVQARMGVVLDRAHEASGVDLTRYASREVPRVGDTVERAGATLQITAIDPPRSGAFVVNASEFHLLRRGGP